MITLPLLVCLYVYGVFVHIFIFACLWECAYEFTSLLLCVFLLRCVCVCSLCASTDTEWANTHDLNEEK